MLALIGNWRYCVLNEPLIAVRRAHHPFNQHVVAELAIE